TPWRQQLSVAIGVSKAQLVPHSTVLFVGQYVNCGAIVSTLVMYWVQMLVLPQQSTAVHLAAMTCGQVPFVKAVRNTPCRQQLSVAIGVSKVHGVPHSTVRLVGH